MDKTRESFYEALGVKDEEECERKCQYKDPEAESKRDAIIANLSDQEREMLTRDPYEVIKAQWGEYTGIAYGASSFQIIKDGESIFHTGFMFKMPKNKEECLEVLKEVIENISELAKKHEDGKNSRSNSKTHG